MAPATPNPSESYNMDLPLVPLQNTRTGLMPLALQELAVVVVITTFGAGLVWSAPVTLGTMGIYGLCSIGPIERGIKGTIKCGFVKTGSAPNNAESTAEVGTEIFKLGVSGWGTTAAVKLAQGAKNAVVARGSSFLGWLRKGGKPAPYGGVNAGKRYAQSKLPSTAINTNVQRLTIVIEEYLGKDFRMIKNKSGDPVFINKDNTRVIRFDSKNPHGHVQFYDKELKNGWIIQHNIGYI